MSHHTMSSHLISHHGISSHSTSNHIISCHIYRIISWCHIIMLYLIISCHVLTYLMYRIMSHYIICRIIPCHANPNTTYHIISYHHVFMFMSNMFSHTSTPLIEFTRCWAVWQFAVALSVACFWLWVVYYRSICISQLIGYCGQRSSGVCCISLACCICKHASFTKL